MLHGTRDGTILIHECPCLSLFYFQLGNLIRMKRNYSCIFFILIGVGGGGTVNQKQATTVLHPKL